MSEQNKVIARRCIEELFNRGNYAVVDELFASDYIGYPDRIVGPKGVKQAVTTLRHAFPDVRLIVEDLIAEGDRIVIRWTAHGTHEGEYEGIPATGKQATVTGIYIERIANGKFVEGWENLDALGLMVQLGVVPATGSPG
jgi:steroid delta-isomerase-like uncharacterized protein